MEPAKKFDIARCIATNVLRQRDRGVLVAMSVESKTTIKAHYVCPSENNLELFLEVNNVACLL